MILRGIMTITEAAKRWHLNTSTLRNAIRERRLQATKSGATWLIAYEDMVASYGDEPRNETD